MKKLLSTASLLLVALLTGCSTGSQPVAPAVVLNPASIQQIAATFCPLVNADLQVLAASPAVQPTLQRQFAQLLQVNQVACAAGASMTLTNLQTINTGVVQAATALLLANPTLPNQPAILLALQLGAPLLNQAIAYAQAQTAAAPATAAVSAPASSASTPAEPAAAPAK